MAKQSEIWVKVPDGQRLVGVKTRNEDSTVIIIIEAEATVNQIGFVQRVEIDEDE